MRESSRWISARSNGVMNCVWSRAKARWVMSSARCSTALMAAHFLGTSVKSSSSSLRSLVPSTTASAWASKSEKKSSDFGMSLSSKVIADLPPGCCGAGTLPCPARAANGFRVVARSAHQGPERAPGRQPSRFLDMRGLVRSSST